MVPVKLFLLRPSIRLNSRVTFGFIFTFDKIINMRSILFSDSEHNFEWINYFNPDEMELEEMCKKFHINPMLIQDVMQAEHLPKVEMLNEEGGFFLIARALDKDAKDFSSIQGITRKFAIFYNKGALVTIHRGDFPWIKEIAEKPSQNQTQFNGYQIVCKLLKACFRSFEPLVFKLSEDIDFYEHKLFSSDKFPPFAKSLYSIKRKSAVLKRLFVVSNPIVELLREYEENQPFVQDTIDMFTRIDTLVEELNDRTATLINLNLSISSQRSNEAMRFLTVYSAFFMPLTFLVGVYGMNFKFMPELELVWAYPATWALMAGLALIHFLWFRRKGWL